MTLTLNDTIELLKAILEECGIECIVLIINLIVACRTVLVPSFNAIKTHGIAFALPKLFLLFYENLDKIYQEIPRFSPFILPFTPLIFTFWRGEKCHRNHFFLLLRAFFSFFLCKRKVYFGMLEREENIIMAGSQLTHQEPAIFFHFTPISVSAN